MPRPPRGNPFLDAIKARGGGGDETQARPPNPFLASIAARGPKGPDPVAAALAERNAASGVGGGLGLGEIGVPTKKRPPPLPKKK